MKKTNKYNDLRSKIYLLIPAGAGKELVNIKQIAVARYFLTVAGQPYFTQGLAARLRW